MVIQLEVTGKEEERNSYVLSLVTGSMVLTSSGLKSNSEVSSVKWQEE